jgi:hypothetical protein
MLLATASRRSGYAASPYTPQIRLAEAFDSGIGNGALTAAWGTDAQLQCLTGHEVRGRNAHGALVASEDDDGERSASQLSERSHNCSTVRSNLHVLRRRTRCADDMLRAAAGT